VAASKDVFEPHTFGANAFAAGAFRGLGIDVDPADAKYPAGGSLTRGGPVGELLRSQLVGRMRRAAPLGEMRRPT
jgi:hypothetical protein